MNDTPHQTGSLLTFSINSETKGLATKSLNLTNLSDCLKRLSLLEFEHGESRRRESKQIITAYILQIHLDRFNISSSHKQT